MKSPDWIKANRYWRAVVTEAGVDAEKSHEALKAHHGVDSFADLSPEQIYQSADRIKNWVRERDDELPPVDEYGDDEQT